MDVRACACAIFAMGGHQRNTIQRPDHRRLARIDVADAINNHRILLSASCVNARPPGE